MQRFGGFGDGKKFGGHAFGDFNIFFKWQVTSSSLTSGVTTSSASCVAFMAYTSAIKIWASSPQAIHP